eukprot:g5972.t1
MKEILQLEDIESKLRSGLQALAKSIASKDAILTDDAFELERKRLQNLLQSRNGHDELLKRAEEALDWCVEGSSEMSIDELRDAIFLHRNHGEQFLYQLRALTLDFASPKRQRERKMLLQKLEKKEMENKENKMESKDGQLKLKNEPREKRSILLGSHLNRNGDARGSKNSSKQVTGELKKISALLSQELERVAEVSGIVEEDNEIVKSANKQYEEFNQHLSAAQGVLTVLKRRDSTDMWYIAGGFFFFCSCVFYIFAKRLRLFTFFFPVATQLLSSPMASSGESLASIASDVAIHSAEAVSRDTSLVGTVATAAAAAGAAASSQEFIAETEGKRRKNEEGKRVQREKTKKEEGSVKKAEEEARRAAVEKEKEEEARRAAVEKEKEEEARRAAVEKEKEEEARRAAVEKEKEEEARRAAVEKEKEEEARRAAVEKKKEEEARRAAVEK